MLHRGLAPNMNETLGFVLAGGSPPLSCRIDAGTSGGVSVCARACGGSGRGVPWEVQGWRMQSPEPSAWRGQYTQWQPLPVRHLSLDVPLAPAAIIFPNTLLFLLDIGE